MDGATKHMTLTQESAVHFGLGNCVRSYIWSLTDPKPHVHYCDHDDGSLFVLVSFDRNIELKCPAPQRSLSISLTLIIIIIIDNKPISHFLEHTVAGSLSRFYLNFHLIFSVILLWLFNPDDFMTYWFEFPPCHALNNINSEKSFINKLYYYHSCYY